MEKVKNYFEMTPFEKSEANKETVRQILDNNSPLLGCMFITPSRAMIRGGIVSTATYLIKAMNAQPMLKRALELALEAIQYEDYKPLQKYSKDFHFKDLIEKTDFKLL